jgi:cysteine synthase
MRDAVVRAGPLLAPRQWDDSTYALPVVSNMLDLVGGTPLVRLRRLPGVNSADLFVKCEQFNPGGSVKDRVALAMIERAERAGRLIPGRSVVVEATSGNTGVGLALICALKGYKLVLTMPDNMSIERRTLLRAYGAEVLLTPAASVMYGAVDRAIQLCVDNPDHFMPQQFENPANVETHLRTTGPEIVAQLEQFGRRSCDAFVAGVGTGGTVTGVGRVLRRSFGNVKIVAVEPSRSAVLSGGDPEEHRIDGIGPGFIAPILDRSLISEVRCVSDEEAQRVKLDIARQEGLLVGISSGAAVKVALEVAAELGPGKTVVTVLPDTGERYFSLDALFEQERRAKAA